MPVETRPMKCGTNWPIVHRSGAAAKSTTLLNASGGMSSHWITGYQLDGTLLKDDGFWLLRRSCLYFDTDDTWIALDGGTLLDWSDDSAGHFTLEMWVYIPTATGAVTGLLTRGTATNGWVLSVGATGLVTFTVDDNTIATALTITSTKSVHGGWHLITVQCERASTTGLRLFIDGVSDPDAKSTVLLTEAVAADTTLDCTGTSNKKMWVGPIGIYHGADAVLSAATILANYNEGIGRKYDGGETGLVLAWNNDEGTGTICYNIQNTAANLANLTTVTWSPSKQAGATAAIEKCGPPFRKQYENDADNPLPSIGLFKTATVIGTGENVIQPVAVSFPEAIEIGRNNPVRILEPTTGTFDLILHGFTADA